VQRVALPGVQTEQAPRVGGAARADHQFGVRGLQAHDLGQRGVVLRPREVGLRHAAPGADEEEEVQRHRASALCQLDQRGELVAVLVEQRGLQQHAQAGLPRRARAVQRALPGAGNAAQAVVKAGPRRVDADAHADCAGAAQGLRARGRQQHAVGAHHRHQFVRGRLGDERIEVAPQQRLATGEHEHRAGSERAQLGDDAQCLGGVEFARGFAAALHRVEVAVGAGEVADPRQVPRDDARRRSHRLRHRLTPAPR